MSDDEGRSILHYQLSELLGFDDGVADVIEHLLSIESSEVGLCCVVGSNVCVLLEVCSAP